MSLHTLASWEIPPDSNIPVSAPAYSRTLVPLGQSQRLVTIRLVRFTPDRTLIFVRAEGDREEGSWVLMPFRNSYYEIPQPTKLSKQVHYDFATEPPYRHCLARLYTWPVKNNSPVQFVIVTSTGATWLNSNFRNLSEFKFEQVNFENILNWSSRKVRAELKREIEDSTSDAHFSYNWAGMSRLEKRIFLAEKLEDEETFSNLARWLLQSTDWIWEIATSWNWSISRDRTDILWFLGGKPPINYAHPIENNRRFEFFLRWQKWLVDTFDPFHNQREYLMRNHRCIGSDYSSIGYFNFTHKVESEIPTPNERLQAKINLRNWAKANLSPQEIALLLQDGF